MNEVLLLSMTYLAAVIPAAMAQPNEHALFKNSDAVLYAKKMGLPRGL
jgi:hypothetical protein